MCVQTIFSTVDTFGSALQNNNIAVFVQRWTKKQDKKMVSNYQRNNGIFKAPKWDHRNEEIAKQVRFHSIFNYFCKPRHLGPSIRKKAIN